MKLVMKTLQQLLMKKETIEKRKHKSDEKPKK